jgi:hypothetical protein
MSDEKSLKISRETILGGPTPLISNSLNDSIIESLQNKYTRLIPQTVLLSNLNLINQSKEIFKKDSNQLNPNIVKIKTKDPSVLFNKIFANKDMLNNYNTLNSAEISLLVPYLRIFKHYEDNSLEEIKFGNYTSYETVKSIFENSSDRGHEALIKSFSLKSQGKDTATAFQYTAKIQLHFDSIDVCLNSDYKYYNLWNPSKKINEVYPDIADPKYFRILIEWGWVFDFNLLNIPAEVDIRKLVAFSNASIIRMFMNYIQHDFTINQDGSVSMTIEYIGSTDAMFETSKSSNVFAILSKDVKNNSDTLQGISDRRANIEKQYNIQGTGTFTDGFKLIDKTTGKEADNTIAKSYVETLEKDKEALEQINETNSTSIFESIINNIYRLYNYDIPYLTLDQQKLKQKILEDIVGDSKKYDDLKKIQEIKTISDTTNIVTIANKSPPADTGNTLFNMEQENLYYFTFEDLLLAFNLAKNENSINDFAKILLSDINILTVPKSMSENKVINNSGNSTQQQSTQNGARLLTYGLSKDDYSEDQVKELKSKGENFNSRNLKLTLQDGSAQEIIINGGEAIISLNSESINIADIPISYETFRKWFLINIMNKNISSMSTKEFIESCCNDLLPRAINAKENIAFLPKQPFKFTYQILTVEEQNLNIYNNQIDLDALQDNQYSLSLVNKSSNSANLKNICIISAISNIKIDRKADLTQDLKEGIFHASFGNTTGLVNNINFRKEQMPYQREASIQSQVEKSQINKPGTLLRGKYNVTLSMFGGINWKLGSLLHIKPTFTGLKDIDAALDLGIGGYYRVIGTSTEIESGKYIVEVETLWEANGRGTAIDPRNRNDVMIIKLPKAAYIPDAPDSKPK